MIMTPTLHRTPGGPLYITDERDYLLELAQDLPDVISLGLGDPDFATPAHIVAAATDALRDGRCHGYTDPAGLRELRRAIAAKLARENGIVADPETEVTVSTGRAGRVVRPHSGGTRSRR